MTDGEIITRAESIFEAGYRAIQVTMKDGSVKIKRMFKSDGRLCIYKLNSKTVGYDLARFVIMTSNWESIRPYGPRGEDTIYEHFCKNLRKYQLAFTNKVHPNLWTNHQADYKRLNVDAFKAYVEGSQTDTTRLNDLHEALREYCHIFNIENIVFENRYQTCSVSTYPPDRGCERWQYNAYTLNAQRHLDQKEDFHYAWRSRSYDVSVSGNTGKDGIYRAWLSLEFRNKGNGHYYLLINSKTAVFSEDD